MSTLDPKQPTALVTGGSRGIGQAIAETLAHDGYQVLLTYQSKAQEAEAVVEKIKAQGGKARCAKLDVGEEEAITDFFASIKEEINLTCLVNNAGITKDGLLIRMKTEDFQKVIQVCLTGTFLCSREAAKLMTKKRTGRIINITSVVGLMGNAGQANYAAAKAGIIGLTKSCARELAARNITCNAVAPGFIETDMTAKLPAEVKTEYVESIPLKRMGTVQDVAKAVSFLASEAASYITGQILQVNGGLYL